MLYTTDDTRPKPERDPEIQERSSLFRMLPKSLKLIWQSSPHSMFGVCVITVVQGFFPTVGLWIGKLFLDAIVDAIQRPSSSEKIRYLVFILLLQFAFQAISYGINSFREYISDRLGDLLSQKISVDIFGKSIGLDLSHFDIPAFHDKLQRASSGAASQPMKLLGNLFGVIRNLITLISMIWLLIGLSWILAVGACLLTVPIFLVGVKFGKEHYDIQMRRTQTMRRRAYLSNLLTGIFPAKEIRTFGLGAYLLDRWSELNRCVLLQNKNFRRRRILGQWVVELISIFGLGTASAYIIYLGITKPTPLTAGTILMYIGAFGGARGSLSSVFQAISGMYEGSLFLQHLYFFLDTQPLMNVESTRNLPVPNRIESIEFRNVCFKYPLSNKYVLKDINLKFSAGENIFVLGPNGAGKTTLIKLMNRLYDPTEGEILLNSVDLKEYDLSGLRKLFGIIYQDYLRFSLTVAENIGFGKLDDISDIEKVKAAARSADADAFINELAQKYQTPLTKLFEDGQELSTGQWQRIALARLFMSSAKIMVLDEPTANLDIEAEARIMREFSRLARDRISIMISHRFSAIDIAERIVLIDNGRVLEEGSHEELMEMQGQYCHFYELYRSRLVATE